jgi:hypothetical protein
MADLSARESRRLPDLNRPTGFSYKVVLVRRLSIEFACRLPGGPADRYSKIKPHYADVEPFGLHSLTPEDFIRRRRINPPDVRRINMVLYVLFIGLRLFSPLIKPSPRTDWECRI